MVMLFVIFIEICLKMGLKAPGNYLDQFGFNQMSVLLLLERPKPNIFMVRRVGRPHKEWIPAVLPEAFKRKQSHEQLYELARDSSTWSSFVRR